MTNKPRRNSSPLLKMGKVKHLDRLIDAGRVSVRLDFLRRIEEMETAAAAQHKAWQRMSPENVTPEWWADNMAGNADSFHASQQRAIDDLKALLVAVDRLDADENPPLANMGVFED